MNYLSDGYTVLGGFSLEDGIQLQFGKEVDGVYNIVTERYTPDHSEYAWAQQQIEEE